MNISEEIACNKHFSSAGNLCFCDCSLKSIIYIKVRDVWRNDVNSN